MRTSEKILIGSGTFGQVYMVNKDGRKYAVKRMEIGKKIGIRNDIVREVVFLRDLRDTDIVPRLKWVNFSSTHVEVSMDHYEMSLSDYIKETKMPERLKNLWTVYDFFLNAFSTFVTRNFQHYDMKPGNIVINKTGNGLICKVVDFGFSCYARGWDQKDKRKAGTRWYRAPEFLSSKSPRIAFMSDAWAIGMSLLHYIRGEALWRPRDNDDLKDCISGCYSTSSLSMKKVFSRLEEGERVKGGIDVSRTLDGLYDKVPKKIVKFIENCLQFDPRERARKMYLDKDEFSFSTGTLRNPSTSIEKILSEKLYASKQSTLKDLMKSSGKNANEIVEGEKDYLIGYINDEGTTSARM